MLRARAILTFAVAVAILSLPGLAQPIIKVAHIQTPPSIDGVLGDTCWSSCEKAGEFKDSSYGRDVAEPTQVMLCQDRDYLYVAFICHDSRPSEIRAVQKQINGDIANDDYVSIMIDSDHEYLVHYHFEINAIGTQYRSLPDGAASNITWRGDWQAASKINDSGWCAEMAIPFRAMRYRPGADTFGLEFRRYVPHIDERSCWPYAGAVFDQTRMADLVGLELPEQSNRPVLMPYTVTSSQPGRSFTDVGLDYKYQLGGRHTALATYNPDFSDVQDAVASISYSYTERFLPERRPFFEEGANLFPDNLAFYSRRIEEINWGAKTFGKSGPHQFALMDAVKSGEENHLAAGYAYNAGPDTSYSVFATSSAVHADGQSDPASSTCISPGFLRRWRSSSGITTFAGRHYSALNSEGRPDGSALRLSMGRDTGPGALSYSLGYDRTDSNYWVRDAYIPLAGVRGFSANLGIYDRPTKGSFTERRLGLSASRHWAEDDSLHNDGLSIAGNLHTRREWAFGSSVSSGSWLGLADSTSQLWVSWLERHLYGNGQVTYSIGKRSGRDYADAVIGQSFKLGARLSFNLRYEWTRLGAPGVTERNSQFTILSNYEISRDRSLGLWMVGQGSNRNLCITCRQTVRSGSDIYLIYGFPNTVTTQKRVALKVVTPITW